MMVLRFQPGRYIRRRGRDMVLQKKHLIIVCIMMMFCHSDSQSQTLVEIQCGVNVAKLSDPGNLISGVHWKTRLGFIGGISTLLSATENVLIHIGLRYVQKGVKSEWYSLFYGNVEAMLTNQYIELPLYIKVACADFGTQVFVFGGPSFSYLLSSTQTADTQFMGHISQNSKEDYRSYDITCDAGLSTSTPLNEHISLTVSTLYSFGVVHVSRFESDMATRDLRIMIGTSFTIQ